MTRKELFKLDRTHIEVTTTDKAWREKKYEHYQHLTPQERILMAESLRVTIYGRDRVYARLPRFFLTQIEIFASISGVDFYRCYARRMEIAMEGVKIPIIGLADLRENKRAAGRLQDLADLENPHE